MPDINKVGFFQADNPSSPIKSLREHLEAACRHLSDCLVVLPEAFNYWPYSRENGSLDTSTGNCLRTLSDLFGVAFVAGLIENGEGGKLGYSSACLIDGDVYHVLSRKTEGDGLVDYRRYAATYYEPRLHRALCIAALICMDASSNSASGSPESKQAANRRYCCRQMTVRERTKGDHIALCIPSRMSQIASGEVASYWRGQLPGSVVILANAAPKWPSVIRPEGTLVHCECRGGNILRIEAVR